MKCKNYLFSQAFENSKAVVTGTIFITPGCITCIIQLLMSYTKCNTSTQLPPPQHLLPLLIPHFPLNIFS